MTVTDNTPTSASNHPDLGTALRAIHHRLEAIERETGLSVASDKFFTAFEILDGTPDPRFEGFWDHADQSYLVCRRHALRDVRANREDLDDSPSWQGVVEIAGGCEACQRERAAIR